MLSATLASRESIRTIRMFVSRKATLTWQLVDERVKHDLDVARVLQLDQQRLALQTKNEKESSNVPRQMMMGS
jgi:hypothetical protein